MLNEIIQKEKQNIFKLDKQQYYCISLSYCIRKYTRKTNKQKTIWIRNKWSCCFHYFYLFNRRRKRQSIFTQKNRIEWGENCHFFVINRIDKQSSMSTVNVPTLWQVSHKINDTCICFNFISKWWIASI